jgi:uncharacterized surface protein with fasciclin (FAS1) repeats
MVVYYDCLQNILNSNDFTTIKSLLVKYNLLDSVSNLSNGTVYLPTNYAFAQIADVIKTLTEQQILDILLYHVSTYQINSTGNTVLCALSGQPLLASKSIVNNICIICNCKSINNTDVNVINTVLLPFNSSACLLK